MNALAKRAARAVFAALPVDPSTIWRELSNEQRAAFRSLLELAAGAQLIAPPAPPDALRAGFAAAGAEFCVAPALLEAIAWEMSRHGADGPLMGLEVPTAAEQIRGAAFVLRRLSDEHGLAAALASYAPELAGRIAGTMALISARGMDAGGVENVRSVLDLLEG